MDGRRQREAQSQAARPGVAHTLCLRGEVVHIREERGQRVVKLAVRERSIVALSVVTPSEIHLGDQVVVEARLGVDSLIRSAASASPEDEGISRPTGGSDER